MLPIRRNEQNWLPEIFNDFFDTNWMAKANATAPAINVLDNEKSYELELAAPGLTKDDFKVSLDEEGNLSIDMEKKVDEKADKKHGHYLRREFSYSKYQQIMTLPDDADREKIEAKVENGVLCVNIPKVVKVAPENTHKMIEIK
jgi:HSP20 family protein